MPESDKAYSARIPILYLHGFASSPGSKKAQDFRKRFEQIGVDLCIPDLNGPSGFASLTLTSILQIATDEALRLAEAHGREPLVIGSSLGGYTALRLGAMDPTPVCGVYAMCPALDFLPRLQQSLGKEAMAQWKEQGSMPVFNYATGQEDALGYALIQDSKAHPPIPAAPLVPTRIVHGHHDESVPVDGSVAFANTHADMVQLSLLESDHGLLDVVDDIWVQITAFIDELR